MARNGYRSITDLLTTLWLATLGVVAGIVLGLANVISPEAVVALVTGSTVGPLTYSIGHRRAAEAAELIATPPNDHSG